MPSRSTLRALLPSALIVAAACALIAAAGVAASGGPERRHGTSDEAARAEAREQVERWRIERGAPEAKRSRAESRSAHRGLGRAEALGLARARFRGPMTDPLYSKVRDGYRVVDYLSDFKAVVERADGKRELLRAMGAPLRSDVATGEKEPVDLTFQHSGGAFRPANPLVPIAVSESGEVSYPGTGIAVRVAGANEVALVQSGEDRLFGADVLPDTDLIVAGAAFGARLMFQLRSPEAPESIGLDFDLPAGARIRRSPEPATRLGIEGTDLLEIARGDEVIATVAAPGMWDADGQPIRAEYSIDGSRVEVRFEHRGEDLLYPLLLDPDVWRTYNSSDWGGWSVFSNDPSIINGWVAGGALYLTNGTGVWFDGNEYAEWRWTPGSPWQINSVHYSGLSWTHNPSYDWTLMCMRVAIAYSPGQPIQTYQTWCPSSVPNNAWTLSGGYSIGNYAFMTMYANGHGGRWYQAHAHVSGVTAYLGEWVAPSVTSGPPSSSWRDDGGSGVTYGASGSDSHSGLQRLELWRSGGSLQASASNGSCSGYGCSSTFSANLNWPSSNLTEGTNTGALRAFDYYGNSSSWQTFDIRIDRTPPSYAGNELSGGLWDRRGKYVTSSLSMAFAPRDPYSGVKWERFLVDGGVAAGPYNESCDPGPNQCPTAPAARSYTFNPASYTDGPHQIEAEAADYLNHVRSGVWRFDVLADSTAPSQPTLSGATNAGWTDSGSWSTSATSSDRGTAPAGQWGSGVHVFELLDGSQPVSTKQYTCDETIASRCRASETHTFNYSAQASPPAGTASLAEGVRTLSVRARDRAGRNSTASSTWQVKVDRGAPQLSVSGALRAAAGQALQEGPYALSVLATDGTPGGAGSAQRSGVRKVEILVDGEIEETLEAACPEGSCSRSLSWTLDTENYPAGDTPVEVVAHDELGHAAREHWTVRIPGELTDDPLEALAQTAADIPPVTASPPGPVPLGIPDDDAYGAEKRRAATELFLPDDLSDPEGGGSDTDGLLAGDVATAPHTPGPREGLVAEGTSTPPDTTGAIGPSHFVEMVNRQVGVFSRADLSLVTSLPLAEFIGADGDNAFDPQILWDQRANRWFYAADRRRQVNGTFENYLAFGWSRTADPSDLANGWCNFFVNTGGFLDDYPKLGHSNRHLVIGANVFPATQQALGRMTTARIWAIPKPERGVTTCDRPRTFRWPRASDPETDLNVNGQFVETPVPAATAASSYNGWVFSADGVQSASAVATEVTVLHISGPRLRPRLTRDGVLEVPRYRMPPDAPQPGTDRTLDTHDARFTQAVAETDPDADRLAVWTQHTVRGRGGRAAVRWYQFLPRTRAAGTIRQRGTIGDAAHHLFNAAVAPTGNGGAVINYNAGSSTLLTEIRARSRTRSAALGSMGGGITLARSAAAAQDETCFDDRPTDVPNPTVCRWGDYAGASQDPLDENVVWGANQVTGPPRCGNTPIPPITTCEPTREPHWRTWILPLRP